jgi:hypothetical protein
MASATPTIVLVPLCVPGHLPSLFEAGKRLLGASGGAMSLTVLLMQMTMEDNLMYDVADLIRREAGSGLDIRFHHLPAVELPTDSHGVENFIMHFIQLHAPHVKAALSGLASPVAAVVVDYFCTTLFDAIRDLALPVYVYLPCSAAMLALILLLPALDEEVAGDLGDMEGAVDVPGMPPWVLRGPVPDGGHSPYPSDANVDELLPEGFLERTKDREATWAPQKAREKAAEAKALFRRAVEWGGSSDVSLQKLAREMLERRGCDAEACASASASL